MRYLLDTNICIYIIRNQPEQVRRKLLSLEHGEAVLSVITFGELLFGAEKSAQREKNRKNAYDLLGEIPLVPMPASVGDHYGRIRAALERSGRPIGPNDLWIAAHALALDLTLVSNNTREFERIEGLKLENWG